MAATIIEFPNAALAAEHPVDAPADARRDEVGELMRELYREVQAEPLTLELLEYSLSQMPVGRYDDSVIHPRREDDDEEQ